MWSGDAQTPREMSDEHLAAAMRSNLLDDRARIEADLRDLDDLLVPAPLPDHWGRLADDAVWAEVVGGTPIEQPDEEHEEVPRITLAQARGSPTAA